MKAVILAGGLGSRISEETETRPKPMIEIGGRPILWHIMKIYAAHGINEFVVCLGYKGYVIKEFFANYYLHSCDVTFDLAPQRDRGAPEQGRAVAGHAGRHRRGDDDRRPPAAGAATTSATRTSASPTATASPTSTSRALVEFHREQRHGSRRSRRCSRPAASARWRSTGERVTGFAEKPHGDGGWINGGFFVLSPERARAT